MPTPIGSGVPSTPVIASSGIWYVTREEVMSAPDVQPSGRHIRDIDKAIESSSRTVEGFLHRKFYPVNATRTKDFPNTQHARSGRIWLDADELVSVSEINAGGVIIPSTDYYLEPNNAGPPYNRIEINRSTNSVLASLGGTSQRAISITGVWAGCDIVEADAGTTAASLTTSDTSILTEDPFMGVGSMLRIDNERMIVTARNWITSGQGVQTPLTASAANTTVAVTDGSVFMAGEDILVDAERMLVTDIAGNNLIVQRAAFGTVLAAHAGGTVYWPRNLSVLRGQLGTTAATHAIDATIYRYIVPGGVAELTKAYTLNTIMQNMSGYARTIGVASEGVGKEVYADKGLRRIEDAAYDRYGRKVRMRSVG